MDPLFLKSCLLGKPSPTIPSHASVPSLNPFYTRDWYLADSHCTHSLSCQTSATQAICRWGADLEISEKRLSVSGRAIPEFTRLTLWEGIKLILPSTQYLTWCAGGCVQCTPSAPWAFPWWLYSTAVWLYRSGCSWWYSVVNTVFNTRFEEGREGWNRFRFFL